MGGSGGVGITGQEGVGMGCRSQRLKGQRAWGIGMGGEGSKDVRHCGPKAGFGLGSQVTLYLNT